MIDPLLKHLLRVFVVAAILTSAVEIAMACSCAAPPTVLDDYERSDLVIIARVLSVEKVKKPGEDEYPRYVDNVRSTTVVVEKVYKGNVRVRDELVFSQGSGANTRRVDKEGKDNAMIKSSEVTIEGDQDVFDLVIKFPFPACKRKE